MTDKSAQVMSSQRRVAIVAGLRTPFVKSGTLFKNLSTQDLACACVSELLGRNDLAPQHIERVVYGQVVVSPQTPNIAREVVLQCGLPRHIDAVSVSRACTTSTQAIIEGAMAIMLGDIEVALCGGADSLSRPPITYQDGFVDALMQANGAKTPLAKAKSFLRLKPRDLVPKPPALREPSTRLTMGESAEIMAKQNGISRRAQDEFASRSHRRAAAAWEQGIFDDEVMHLAVPPDFGLTISRDAIVRPDTTPEKLSSLRPSFDKQHGSITAGNASPLTDGASAVVLMEAGRAKALGLEPLAFIKSWAQTAVDPAWQLLMAPTTAIPRALKRAGMTLADIDLVDMHEAFAAQVLSNTQALACDAFNRQHNGCGAVGEVDVERLNIYGGSIALGHPFAATGARQALTMAQALRRRGKGAALISQCAAGGLGSALILERV